MRVVISVGGIFHAFDLAEQLAKRDILETIFTTYPKFKVDQYDVDSSKIRSVRHPEVIKRSSDLPIVRSIVPQWLATRLDDWKGASFDWWVSRKLPTVEDGVFVGFAGNSLKSLKEANKAGYTTVVERSSVHIKTQRDILQREAEEHQSFEQPIKDRRLQRETEEYKAADYILTPSSFVRQSFLDRCFDPETVKRVPLGKSFPADRDCQDNRSGDDSTHGAEVTFVFCGGVRFRKGVHYLLAAWDEAALPEAELVLLSPIQDDIKDVIAPYRSRDDIQFTGWVDDIHAWYSRGDAFVLPSIEDGFGMTVIEAMASGLPPIVTENVGAKDCIRPGEDGLVVPAGDSEALADALKYMYENPEERLSMGVSACKRARTEYTADAYGERIVATYRDMLESQI